MTGEALIDTSLRAGGALRHHAEMLHEMAGRRLVALGALGRVDRGMAVVGDPPARGRVAAGAVLAEQAQVRVADRMATRAVERRLGRHGERSGKHRRSEEHTSELQSLMRTSYAVFCLKKKTHVSRPTTHPHNNH